MISTAVKKADDSDKLLGRALYIDDYTLPEMLYAKTLRSSRMHANILKIVLPQIPDGYTIVDRNDIPGKNRVKIVVADQPFFAEDVVNYIGEPILLVVGPKRDVLDRILSEIHVEYEDLLPANDTLIEYSFGHGDIADAFENAHKIFSWRYETGYQEHSYLEPNGVIGEFDGTIVRITGSIQCPFYVKNAVVDALGFNPDNVHIIQSTTGGAFGGKEDFPSLIAGHVALAAIKTGKPVKLTFGREEDMLASTKRHPSVIHLRSAIDKTGNLRGLEADITLDGGSYTTLSPVVLQRAMFAITGVYNFPAVSVKGKVIRSNTVPSGAFRGFGCPQAIFAIETHMQNCAKAINIDPVKFKMLNFVKKGDLTCTGGIHRHEIKLDEIAAKIIKSSGYSPNSNKNIGISFFLHGCGFTGSGEQDYIKAEVILKKLDEKTVEILVSSTDMGQGIQTTLRKIVSKVLSIPFEHINYENPDTSKVPDSGPTVASRTIMIVGKLVEEAALELKDRWNEAACITVFKKFQKSQNIEWNQEKMRGDAYPSYSWGANAALVEVSPITFETTVQKIWSVYDIGVAIDERIVEGQIQGGILQGVGFSHLEVMDNVNGRFMQKNLTDYVIPTSMDSCPIENSLVENPYEGGPFGAKGLGEITLVGSPAAVAGGISKATGLMLNKLPLSPEYLMEVSKNAGKRN